MKNLKKPFAISSALMVSFAGSMFFSGCKPNSPATLQIQADVPRQYLKSGVIASPDGSFITLESARIEIRNLNIENSAGRQGKNNNQAGNAGNLSVPGPYLFNIFIGTIPVDEVLVQPGRYKTLCFDFFAGPDNELHGLVLRGAFTDSRGTTVPFCLMADIDQTVRLQFPGNGMRVKPGQILSATVSVDLYHWLKSIDLNQASAEKEYIRISKKNNQALYDKFVAQTAKNVSVKMSN